MKDLNVDGTTILLVEQNVRKALQYAKEAYVCKTRRIVLNGTPEGPLWSKQFYDISLGTSAKG